METETLILPPRSASRTMAATRQSSSLPSLHRAHCKLPQSQRIHLLNNGSVTAVGGTTFVPETAIFFSGGGFSNFVSAMRKRESLSRCLMKKGCSSHVQLTSRQM